MALHFCRILGIAVLLTNLTYSLGIPLVKDSHSSDNHYENEVLNLQKKNSIASLDQEKDSSSAHFIRKRSDVLPPIVTSHQLSYRITKESINKKNEISSADASNELETTLQNKKAQSTTSTTGQSRTGNAIEEGNATLINGKTFTGVTESHLDLKSTEVYTTTSFTSASSSKTDASHSQKNGNSKIEDFPGKDFREKVQSVQQKIPDMKLKQDVDSGKDKTAESVKVNVNQGSTLSPKMVTTRKNDHHQNKSEGTEYVTQNPLGKPTIRNILSLVVTSSKRDTSSNLIESVTRKNVLNQKTISSSDNGTASTVATTTPGVKEDYMSSQENVTSSIILNRLSSGKKFDREDLRSDDEQSVVKENVPNQKAKVSSLNETPIPLALTTVEVNKDPKKIISNPENAPSFVQNTLSSLIKFDQSQRRSNLVQSVTTENVSIQKANIDIGILSSTTSVTSGMDKDSLKVVPNHENTTPTVKNIFSSSMKPSQPSTISNLEAATTSDKSSQKEKKTSKSVASVASDIKEDHQKFMPKQDNTTPHLDQTTSKITDHEYSKLVMNNPENDILSPRVSGISESKFNEDTRSLGDNFLKSDETIPNKNSKLGNSNDGTSTLQTTDKPGHGNFKIDPDNSILDSDTNKTMDLFWLTLLSSWNDNYTSRPREISSNGDVTLIPGGITYMNEFGISHSSPHGNVTSNLGTTVRGVSENNMNIVKENGMNVVNENGLQSLSQVTASTSPGATGKSASESSITIFNENGLQRLSQETASTSPGATVKDVSKNVMPIVSENVPQRLSQDSITSSPGSTVKGISENSITILNENGLKILSQETASTSPSATVKGVSENGMKIISEKVPQRLSQESASSSPSTTDHGTSKLGIKPNHIPLSKNVMQLSEIQELFNGLRLPSTRMLLQREVVF